MDIISIEEARHIQHLFGLFVTKEPVGEMILKHIEHRPYELHGEQIASQLKFESGYIQPILKKMALYGLLDFRNGTGKQHLAKYYAVVPERVNELQKFYQLFKQEE